MKTWICSWWCYSTFDSLLCWTYPLSFTAGETSSHFLELRTPTSAGVAYKLYRFHFHWSNSQILLYSLCHRCCYQSRAAEKNRGGRRRNLRLIKGPEFLEKNCFLLLDLNQTCNFLIIQVNTQNLFVRLGQSISWGLVISLKDNIAIIEFFLISSG